MKGIRTGDRQLIRDINISIVIDAIRQRGPVPRVDIARMTSLGRSTVSGITALLLKEGFIREIGSACPSQGKPALGRRPVLIEFNPRARFVIGVKLAPTLVTAAVTDLEAVVLDTTEMVIDAESGEKAIRAQIARAVRDVMSKARIDLDRVIGIGVALPGIVDNRTGVSISPRFFLWQNLPMRHLLEEEFGVPVFIDNDANAATLGEKWRGRGRDVENLVCMTVGVGIGAGIIINNQLYRGAIAGAGEIGHITINEDGPPCACGNQGCLEAFASDAAMEREMRKVMRSGVKSMVEELVGGDEGRITRKIIVQAAKAGDEAALAVIVAAGQHIGVGLANIVNILNPEMIVIAGEAVQDSGDLLLDPIRETIRRRSMGVLAERVEVVPSALGDKIWLTGAAALVLQDFFRVPIYERKQPAAAVSLPELMQGS
ncbi:MAG: ROK family transcriptional regulator [Bacillota bacterium]